jgi:restriction system protein
MLALLADGADQPVAALRAELGDQFSLTPAELDEELPSGRAKTFANRVGWATTYLYRCGLLDRTSRSVVVPDATGNVAIPHHQIGRTRG